MILQLAELRIRLSTAATLEKDQHCRALGQLFRQRERAASRLCEREIGSD
jgi:hypothetical protein